MPPTTIRNRIIGVTMLMAFILYLDRTCMGDMVKSVSFNNGLHQIRGATSVPVPVHCSCHGS